MKKGKLMVVEGCDGVGKSTAAKVIAEKLRALGRDVILTSEPNGSELGAELRKYIVNIGVSPNVAIALMGAARLHHIETVIVPALNSGVWVVCDRFIDSTYAYQVAGLGGDTDLCLEMERQALQLVVPDHQLLITAPVGVAMSRLAARGNGTDKIERLGVSFYERVAAGFVNRATDNGTWKTSILTSYHPLVESHDESIARFTKMINAYIQAILNEEKRARLRLMCTEISKNIKK